jgi:hypothetical protein
MLPNLKQESWRFYHWSYRIWLEHLVKHRTVDIGFSREISVVRVQLIDFVTKPAVHTIEVVIVWYEIIVNKEIKGRWISLVLSYNEGLAIKPSTLTNIFDTG